MARVPEGVFPRFLTDRGLDIRQPTIENQAHQVAKDVANYLASGGTITVIPPGTSGMVGEKGEYIANLGAWTTPVVQDKGEAAARKRQTLLGANRHSERPNTVRHLRPECAVVQLSSTQVPAGTVHYLQAVSRCQA